MNIIKTKKYGEIHRILSTFPTDLINVIYEYTAMRIYPKITKTILIGDGNNLATAMAVTNEKIYAAIGNKIQMFSRSGDNKFLGSFGDFNQPHGICIKDGKIYVADTGNNRLIKLNEINNELIDSTFVKSPTAILIKTDGWIATVMRDNYPADIVMHENVRYMTDPSDNTIYTYMDVRGYSSKRSFGKYKNDKHRKKKILKHPTGIEIANNTIYVADMGNNMIRLYDKKTYKYMNWFGGYGKKKGQFDSPKSVRAYDNELYVLDVNNNRIQVFSISE